MSLAKMISEIVNYFENKKTGQNFLFNNSRWSDDDIREFYNANVVTFKLNENFINHIWNYSIGGNNGVKKD